MTAKIVVLILVAFVPFTAAVNSAAEELMDTHEASFVQGVQWLYDSPLTAVEEITPIAGGLYEYHYKFENSDSNHIKMFTLHTSFGITGPANTWSTAALWNVGWGCDMDLVLPPYDARNLDPAITCYVTTWYGDWRVIPPAEDVIVPGASVAGLSFVSSVYDPAPKYYYYETVESGRADEEPFFVAAVGLTEAGVLETAVTSWGAVKAVFR